jgi:hypothetical protein
MGPWITKECGAMEGEEALRRTELPSQYCRTGRQLLLRSNDTSLLVARNSAIKMRFLLQIVNL